MKVVLNKTECRELAALMEKKYAAYLNDRKISVSAKLVDEFAYVVVLLKNENESFYYPIEARVLFAKEELELKEAFYFLVNYCDLYLEEFLFSGEEVYLTLDWSNYEYDAVDFQMRGQIQNKMLETLGDQIIESAQVNH